MYIFKTVQDLRLHLKPQAEEKQITFYLSAGTAGDVSTTEKVVWNNPHILRPEQPPLSLTDIPQAIDPQHISPESKT